MKSLILFKVLVVALICLLTIDSKHLKSHVNNNNSNTKPDKVVYSSPNYSIADTLKSMWLGGKKKNKKAKKTRKSRNI